MTKRREHRAAPWSEEKAGRRSFTDDASWASEWIEKLLSALVPAQRGYVDDPSDMITAICSRGAGKSTSSIAKLLITMGLRPKMPCLFIATTREQATEIVWNHLKDIVHRLMIDATFNETKRVMTFTANGSSLKLAGADDRKEIEKLRGLAFAGVVIDEAASHPAKLLENLICRVLGPRMAEYNGWIALVGTPGHELAGPFYEATRRGSREHRPYADRHLPEYLDWKLWSSHRWTLEDGAAHVAVMAKLWAQALIDKARRGWSDKHPIWLREYRAEWAADNTDNVYRYTPYLEGEACKERNLPEGTPWNVWDPERVGPHQIAKLPEGRDDWEYALACDKGFTDMFAVNIFAFSPTDTTKTLFHVFCLERQAFYARRLAELLLGEGLKTDNDVGGLIGATAWPVGAVADADDAFLAEMANVYGVRMGKANKNNGYKVGAIELTNGDLIDGRIKILKGSELETQLLTLQWQVGEFGEVRENKAQPNHSTDCLIYGRRMIAHLFETGAIGESKRRRAPAPDDEPVDVSTTEVWSDLLTSATYGDDEWQP